MNTQFYEIYRRNGQIYGTPLRGETPYRLRLAYDHCFDLQGKTARYFLVTGDNTIGSQDALAFATDHAQGRLVHIHIDLSQMTVTREKGVK